MLRKLGVKAKTYNVKLRNSIPSWITDTKDRRNLEFEFNQ
jgi:hypothetical protein